MKTAIFNNDDDHTNDHLIETIITEKSKQLLLTQAKTVAYALVFAYQL